MNNTSQFSQPSFTHLTSFNTLPVMSNAEFEKSFGISLDKTKKTAKKYAIWSIIGSIIVFLLSIGSICFILWFLVYLLRHV